MGTQTRHRSTPRLAQVQVERPAAGCDPAGLDQQRLFDILPKSQIGLNCCFHCGTEDLARPLSQIGLGLRIIGPPDTTTTATSTPTDKASRAATITPTTATTASRFAMPSRHTPRSKRLLQSLNSLILGFGLRL
jgi:hypothetical protein